MEFTLHVLIGIIVFVSTFYLIVTEKIPPAWSSLGGGLVMVVSGIINEHEAFEAVSHNLEIIFLLMGMMIIVSVLAETGLFQWFAIKMAQLVRGEPFALLALLAVLTAVFSAFLDNVTTILLMAPVSILLAKQLELNAFPFLLAEIMASNIGGGATLIGDPPNLIIGSESGLGFNDFLIHLSPLIVINIFVMIITFYFMFGRKMKVSRDLKARIMELDASKAIQDKLLIRRALTVFFIVIIGFLTNQIFHIGLAIIAVSGAVALAVIIKKTPHDAFKEVEWDTLFFFIGLFILVKGVEELKFIEFLGEKILEALDGNFQNANIFVLWFSALSSGLLGNVSHTVTFSKVIHIMTEHFHGINTTVLWWSLSLGACLGGNLTLVASAANIVGVNVSAKSGEKIGFGQFIKYGALITVESMILSSIYLAIRYL